MSVLNKGSNSINNIGCHQFYDTTSALVSYHKLKMTDMQNNNAYDYDNNYYYYAVMI